MSLSGCVKCWDTPCTCGWCYRNYTREQRIALAAAILGVPETALTLANVPLHHPMKEKK